MKKILLISLVMLNFSAFAKLDIWCADNLSKFYDQADLDLDRKLGLSDDKICHFYPKMPKVDDPRWLVDLKIPFYYTLRTPTHLFVMDTRYYDAFKGWGTNLVHFNWVTLASTSFGTPFQWAGGRSGGHVPDRTAPLWFMNQVRDAMVEVDMDITKFTGGPRLWVDGAEPVLAESVAYDSSKDKPIQFKNYAGVDQDGDACSIEVLGLNKDLGFKRLEVKTSFSEKVFMMTPGSTLDLQLDHVYHYNKFYGQHLVHKLVVNREKAYELELYLNGDLQEPVKFNVIAQDDELGLVKDRSLFCNLD